MRVRSCCGWPIMPPAIAWMFAALTTVEPPIFERSMALMTERDKPWFADPFAVLTAQPQG